MTPDFSSATHELAAALIAAFPQLSFEASAEDDSLTILAGGLQLVVSTVAKGPLNERDDDYAPGLGDYAGFGDRTPVAELVAKPAPVDYESIPVGTLNPIEFKALCQTRIRAQNNQRAFPKDPSYREALDLLTARWGAEIKAQRAAEAMKVPAQEYETGIIHGGRRDGMDLRST